MAVIRCHKHVVGLVSTAVLAMLLAGCAHKEGTVRSGPPATPAVAGPMPADDEAAFIAGLPAQCQDYLARAHACYAKADDEQGAERFQARLVDAMKEWLAIHGDSVLVSKCVGANEHFNDVATTLLKCE